MIQLALKTFVPLLLALVVMLFVVLAGQDNKGHVLDDHQVQLDAIEDITQQLSLAHLWLEEYLSSGDENNLGLFRKHRQMAKSKLSPILNYEPPHSEEDMEAHALYGALADELNQSILAWLAMAEERLAKAPQHPLVESPALSEADADFDALFIKIIDLDEQVEAQVRKQLGTHMGNLNQRNQWMLGLSGMLVFFCMAYVFVAFRQKVKGMQREHELLGRLDQSEEGFRNLFEMSPVALWVEDFSEGRAHIESLRASGIHDLREHCLAHPETVAACAERLRILDVNRAALDLHGADSKETLIAGLAKVYTDESLDVFRDEMLALYDGQVSTVYQTRVKRLDGTLLDVILSTHVMPGHEKALDRVLVAMTNITDTVAAQKMLEDHKNLLDLAQRAGRVGVWDWDPRSGHLMWTDETYRILGLEPGEVQPDYALFLQRIHPDDQPQVEKAVQAALQQGGAYHAQCRIVADGVPEKVCFAQGRVILENDIPVRMVGTFVDVTQRVRVAEAIERSERHLREAQRVGCIGSWDLELTSNALWWSEEVFRILEMDKGKLAASYEAFLDVVHPDDREMVESAFAQHLAERSSYDLLYRLRFVDADGGERIRYVHERCMTERDKSGKALRSLGTVQDVTEQVLAEQEKAGQQHKMEHVQRLESLGVLAGGVAHDFNNLLTTIMGHASLGRLKASPMNDATRSFEAIEDASRQAAELCQQMLAYSGKGKFVVKPLDLSELVREMRRLLQVGLRKNTILREDLTVNLPAIMVDMEQMRQVIMNLVTNAGEAIGERSGVIVIATGMMQADEDYLKGGYIQEEVLQPGRYIWLEVSDTGCGMDDEIIAHLFEPFYTTKFTGRGLGMSAVLGIVRGHKGAIKVYSEQDKGTTIKVLIPASDQTPVLLTQPEGAPEQIKGNGRLVLVVDDEASIRSVAALMLENAGYKTLQAADGIEGVEALKAHRDEVDCVLLDMTMPRMGGEEAFTEMRRIRPDLRVVLSSGYNQQTATQRFTGKGLAGFVQKPYTPDNLLIALDKVLNPPQ